MPSDPAESPTIFDAQWSTYRKVIEYDYMDHGKILAALREFVITSPFSQGLGEVLDLGCGDAEVSSALVREFGCRSFLGIDASDSALRQAGARDDWGGSLPSFRQTDLLSYVRESLEVFDVILVGFSLHHLASDEKREFFSAVRNRLKPGGVVLFYDVFLKGVLDREASIGEYLNWIREEWESISEDEYDAIEEHIATSDFPESAKWINGVAAEAGLMRSGELLNCASGFHRVLAFQA